MELKQPRCAAPQLTGRARTIVCVDTYPLARPGVAEPARRHPDLRPVGEAGTAEDAIRSLPRLVPDVVVIDVEMPGMGGVEGAARIRERAPGTRVLGLSMPDQPHDVRRAFDAGADVYLLKAAADEAGVTSIAMPISPGTFCAATCAPRRPTSSCVAPTQLMS